MFTRRVTGTALAAVLASTSLLLVACGSSSDAPAAPGPSGGAVSPSESTGAADNGVAALPADQILAKAKAAALAAGSVHMTGTAEGTTLNLVLSKSGSSGTISVGGKTVSIIASGSSVYLKADAAFWTQFGGSNGAAVATLVGDRWLKASSTNPSFTSFKSFTDYAALVQSLKPDGTLTKGGTSVVDGTPVIALVDSGTSTKAASILSVATVGEPYPLKTAPVKNPKNEAIFTSEWGTATPQPAPSTFIDVSKLAGALGA